MLIWYENNYKGKNNLTCVMSNGIITTSTKGKEMAIRNHNRKLKLLGVIGLV